MRGSSTRTVLVIALLLLGWLALGFIVQNTYYRLLLTLVPWLSLWLPGLW